MRAGFGFCKRPIAGVLALGLLAFAADVRGQEIRFRPVATTGNLICLPGAGTCGANQIKLSSGGVTVTLFIQVGGWDMDLNGDPTLGAYQGTVDSATYDGGDPSGVGTVAGFDLLPVGQPNNGFQGAFMALKVCSDDAFGPDMTDPVTFLSKCTGNPDCTTPGYPFCQDRPDYVYSNNFGAQTPTVSTATLNYFWSAASTACRIDTDGTTFYYGGSLLLQVPPGAKGTYNVNFFDNPNFTLMNSCPGPPIPGLFRTAGAVTVQTGSCCSDIGPGSTVCENNLLQTTCNARPGPRVWRPDVDCLGDLPDDLGNPEADCPSCQSDADCNNGNACDDDDCDTASGVCSHTPNYSTGVECCDPADGSTVGIDDGNVCTDDACDDGTGDVTHTPNSDPCDDGNDCSYDDTCGGGDLATPGVCSGTDIETEQTTCDPAGDLSDCPDGTTECDGICRCSLCTPVLLNVAAGSKPDDNCFSDGEKVDVSVRKGIGTSNITGGQFLIEYDPACLDLQSVGPCAGSIYNNEAYEDVDEIAGTIFYVATVEPFNRCDVTLAKCKDVSECDAGAGDTECVVTTGTKQAADMACISFLKKDGCDSCNVCFASANPQNTLLVDEGGNSSLICDLGCSKGVRLAGDIDITAPEVPDGQIQSDCDQLGANVSWNTPSATDTCDGDLGVTCSGAFAHNTGEPGASTDPAGIVHNGGFIPQGKWFFECHASNSCGNEDQVVWTVDVKDQTTLDVEVHIGQPVIAGALSRCICFELFADCWAEPNKVCTELDFGPPNNFRGHARDSLKIKKNNWDCLTAQDQLHTLRSSADVECIGTDWVAVWKGDPLLDGNWLIPGNLDGYKKENSNPDVIDVLDFGKFIFETSRGAVYPNGNTTCADVANGPHGDINGDGLVDNIDYGIIQTNFLATSKNACCPDSQAAVPTPITSISVKQLRMMGLAELVVADLNADGMLDAADMDAYESGQVVNTTVPVRKRGTRGTR